MATEVITFTNFNERLLDLRNQVLWSVADAERRILMSYLSTEILGWKTSPKK